MHKYYMLLLIGVSGINAMDQIERITYKDSSVKKGYMLMKQFSDPNEVKDNMNASGKSIIPYTPFSYSIESYLDRQKTDSNDKFFVKFSPEDIKSLAKLLNGNPQVRDVFTLYLQDNSNRWAINTNLNIYEQSKTHEQPKAIISYSEPKTNSQLYSAQIEVPTFDLKALNTRYGRNPANGFEKIQN